MRAASGKPHTTKHLLSVQGMTQSVYDTRVFYRHYQDGFIIAHVHVDDTRLTASSMRIMNEFYTRWAKDLDEEQKLNLSTLTT